MVPEAVELNQILQSAVDCNVKSLWFELLFVRIPNRLVPRFYPVFYY